MEVLKEIQHRWRDLGYHLRMPLSDVQGMSDLVDVYVKHFYAPSWKNVAASLQKMNLHRLADEVTNKYVRGILMCHHSCRMLCVCVCVCVCVKWESTNTG